MTNKESGKNGTFMLITLFGFITLCLLWLTIDYIIENDKKKELADAVTVTQNLARAFEEHTLRTIISTDQMVMFLKYQYEKEGRAIDMAPYHSEGDLGLQPFVLLSIADENGDLIISNQEPFVFSNISDREHFRVHIAKDSGKLFISQPVLGRSSGKWSIQMTRRINKSDGSFGGAAIVSLDPFYFTHFYQQLDLGKGASIALVGLDGIVRAWQSDKGSDSDIVNGDSPLRSHLAVSNAGYYSAISTADGINRINSYRALIDYPFVVVVGMAEDEVLSDFYQRRVRYYGIAIILTLFILSVCGTLIYVLYNRRKAEYIRNAQRHKIEAELARMDRLNLVGEMAASIGHEVRNPMTTVRGYLQFFQRKDEFAKHGEQLSIMIEEIDRANSIITEFLALAKDKTLTMKKGNLNDCVKALHLLLQADAFHRGHNLRMELGEIPDFDFDEKEIRQMILNLVRNGMEAMDSNGVVMIRTYVDSGQLKLVIEDSGSGIPNEVIPKLGTPFVTTKDDGTGLGLAVCYRVAERHGAKIEVSTGPNGTTFTINFNPLIA